MHTCHLGCSASCTNTQLMALPLFYKDKPLASTASNKQGNHQGN